AMAQRPVCSVLNAMRRARIRTPATRPEVEDPCQLNRSIAGFECVRLLEASSVWASKVRFGSNSEVRAAASWVRFSPRSRHVYAYRVLRLRANSRLMQCGNCVQSDYLVCLSDEGGRYLQSKRLCRFEIDHEFVLREPPGREDRPAAFRAGP